MTEEEMDKAYEALDIMTRLIKDFSERHMKLMNLSEEQESWVRLKLTEDMRFWK